MASRNSGIALVAGAYAAWGILPLYWRMLSAEPPALVLLHRVWWSLVFLGIVLIARGSFMRFLTRLLSARVFARAALAGMLISGNWLIYVWAIANNRVIESGLGYFLCPLLSVALAAIVLGERMTRFQVQGLALVLMGVLVRIVAIGELPVVAVSLALTFALYVLVRKSIVADSVEGLCAEVMLSLPLVAGYAWHAIPAGQWASFGSTTGALLVLAGPITAIPLLMLVRGAQHVSLSTAAMLQYISPALTIAIGALLGESFDIVDWITFALIACGIAWYLWAHRWSGALTPRPHDLIGRQRDRYSLRQQGAGLVSTLNLLANSGTDINHKD